MIPWILQTETSKHCLLKLKLGKLGEGVCGREGLVSCFGTFPVLYSFGIFHCFCTSVPYKRRKLSPWSPPGSTKGLRNACNSNTQPNNQKEHSNHAFALKTWDMCNVYCIFLERKKTKKSSDLWHHWWSSHMVKEETRSCSPPQSSSLPPCSPYAAVLFSFPVCPRGFAGLAWVFSSSYRPCPYSKLVPMNWGEMFKCPTRRVQRNTQHCMCAVSDNNTNTRLWRVPRNWKCLEQEGAETVWTGTDLGKRTSLNWQIFLPL